MTDLAERVEQLRHTAVRAAADHRDTRDRSEVESLREAEAVPAEPDAVVPPVAALYAGERPMIEWTDDELAAELAGYFERPWTPDAGERRMAVARESAIRHAVVNGWLTIKAERPPAPIVDGAGGLSVPDDQSGGGVGGDHADRAGAYRASRRRRWNQRKRPVAFVDLADRRGVTDDGERFTLPKRNDVAGLISALPDGILRVLVVGGKPGDGTPEGLQNWSMPAKMPAGWHEHERGHYLESNDLPVLRYRSGDRTLEVQRAAAWFGDSRISADGARLAFRDLDELLCGAFEGAAILATPATTGRDLWTRVIPHGREWPVLSAEVQELIRSTAGQGRIELFEHDEDLPGLCEVDGRFMYAGLCWGLGAGEPVRDSVNEYAGHQRGRYRVRFAVPADWRHVGLLGVKDEGGAWRYPNEPGEEHETWCDGAELAVAIGQGWPVTILERLLFPVESGGPLDLWARKLVSLWERADQAEAEPEHREHVRAALRSIVLHGLGAFVGRRHMVTRSAPVDEPERVPDGAVRLRIEGDRLIWGEHEAAGMWADVVHPEWPAAVWARCRVRLLDGPTGTKGIRSGALHVRHGELVAMRTDALYLTRDPRWPDDGKVGRLRAKSYRRGPLPAPRSHADLLTMRRGR